MSITCLITNNYNSGNYVSTLSSAVGRRQNVSLFHNKSAIAIKQSVRSILQLSVKSDLNDISFIQL